MVRILNRKVTFFAFDYARIQWRQPPPSSSRKSVCRRIDVEQIRSFENSFDKMNICAPPPPLADFLPHIFFGRVISNCSHHWNYTLSICVIFDRYKWSKKLNSTAAADMNYGPKWSKIAGKTNVINIMWIHPAVRTSAAPARTESAWRVEFLTMKTFE